MPLSLRPCALGKVGLSLCSVRLGWLKAFPAVGLVLPALSVFVVAFLALCGALLFASLFAQFHLGIQAFLGPYDLVRLRRR